eukprot:7947637-Pyramimonas_sp.AAC.1
MKYGHDHIKFILIENNCSPAWGSESLCPARQCDHLVPLLKQELSDGCQKRTTRLVSRIKPRSRTGKHPSTNCRLFVELPD